YRWEGPEKQDAAAPSEPVRCKKRAGPLLRAIGTSEGSDHLLVPPLARIRGRHRPRMATTAANHNSFGSHVSFHVAGPSQNRLRPSALPPRHLTVLEYAFS